MRALALCLVLAVVLAIGQAKSVSKPNKREMLQRAMRQMPLTISHVKSKKNAERAVEAAPILKSARAFKDTLHKRAKETNRDAAGSAVVIEKVRNLHNQFEKRAEKAKRNDESPVMLKARNIQQEVHKRAKTMQRAAGAFDLTKQLRDAAKDFKRAKVTDQDKRKRALHEKNIKRTLEEVRKNLVARQPIHSKAMEKARK